jgi:peptidoglycan hydrolase FlgJ
MTVAPSQSPAEAAPGTPPRNDSAKVRDAAQQFEALLLGQILKSVRQSGGGWLGESDASADCATEFAEEHFAAMLARQGGLGLAALIARGLDREQ